jgi:hypothetical protein
MMTNDAGSVMLEAGLGGTTSGFRVLIRGMVAESGKHPVLLMERAGQCIPLLSW